VAQRGQARRGLPGRRPTTCNDVNAPVIQIIMCVRKYNYVCEKIISFDFIVALANSERANCCAARVGPSVLDCPAHANLSHHKS
jgi:hypothetical protein